MFTLALKNILFYKGRSITSFVLIFFSTLLFIVYVSMMDGSHESMLKNALKVYTGAIEIYQKGYRDIGGNQYLITDVKSIEEKLSAVKGIKDFTSRYETYGLLSFKNFSSAALVAGIDPKKEEVMSELKTALIQGKYLENGSDNHLYAGADLVKKLHAKVGDKIAFIGQASDGSFAADILILQGIFKTGSFDFDSMASFVPRRYFDELMYSHNKASYISVNVKDLKNVDAIQKEIAVKMPQEIETLTWKTLMKPMVQAMEVDSVFGYISLALFFIVIFFVVMIFGFINISSRVNELGTLRCIGLSKKNVFLLQFYEIFIISTLAVIFAAPIGAYIAYYYSIHPIVIEGISETYKQYGVISDQIPFDFNLFTISWNIAVIYILSFLSILYPVYYINKFTPTEAIRHV
ncbi:FtsX-like permease family protein [Sulfurimonas sp. HSL3-2]|uniref:ABC transporter permease n=1 Tax=Hydrocurvibacter mobilis TaxID=3131936 RepID=UPI0031F82C46